MSIQYITDGQITHEVILKGGRYRDLSIKGADPETVKNLYAFMLRLRRCEEAIMEEYHPANEMRCPVHFCVGQEAVPAALSLVLEEDDIVFSHHRNHGYYLAKGAPLKALIAEMYGKATGADGGLAGSQEISYPSVNFYSGAILAGGIAIATGAARAFQIQKKPQVSVAAFGDGAADQGVFWEALNFSALYKLPVVFLCENNRYSTFSPQFKRQLKDNISQRAACFGVKAISIFGNDVVAVHAALSGAVRSARAGKGPQLLQAYTYRWYGHVGPEDDDHFGYRPAEELEFWKSNCPIALLEEQMTANGLLTLKKKEELFRGIDKEIEEAFIFAKNSPFPDDTNWGTLNLNPASPLADKLLRDLEARDFDQDQDELIPGPY